MLNPIETWFVTKRLMVERLFKLKPTIEQTIVDLNWIIFVNLLHGNCCQKLLTKVRFVWANIRKEEFWDICANFVHMVELVLVSLRTFDGKYPCMGRAWLIMKTLEQHVLSLQDPPLELPSNLINVIKDQFY
jgi:hypothetical protein